MAKPEVTMMSREDFAKIVNDSSFDNSYVNHHELDTLEETGLGVPVIKNLDACILAAIEAGGVLDMHEWHSLDDLCGTTHCRGGWAIHLAGAAGEALEKAMDTESAAACIYLASTGRVPDFFAENEEALEDMRRGRLTPEREAEIRRDDAGYAQVKFPETAVFQRRELLAEIDALRAEYNAIRVARDMFRRLCDEACARHDALRADFVAIERDNSALRAEALVADAERRGRRLELADGDDDRAVR